MKALAKGIAWLESLGLAHSDLKPENVLTNKIASRLGISIIRILSVQNSKHVYLYIGGSSVAKLG